MNAYATFTAIARHASPDWTAKLANTVIKVYVNRDDTFFCDAPEFGCSRDYAVTSPSDAVIRFLGEHGFYLVRVAETPTP